MKNILIIRYSALGDLVVFEPIFRIIREYYKDANIIFLTSSIGKELYADTNYFNQVVVSNKVFECKEIFKDIYFDQIINLQCTKKSHYITLFLRKKKLINRGSDLSYKLLGIKKKEKTIAEILKASGIPSDKIEEYEREKELLIRLPAKKIGFEQDKKQDKKIVAISTGSSYRWVSKRWGIDKYRKLIKLLVQDNIRVILIGTKLELDDAKMILEENPCGVESYVDKTSFLELKSILKSVDLFVGNDSGPTHIAAAVGTDTLTLFGSTSDKHSVRNFPYLGRHRYLMPKENIICAPCYKSKCPKKGYEYMQCMESIGVDNVYSMIRTFNLIG